MRADLFKISCVTMWAGVANAVPIAEVLQSLFVEKYRESQPEVGLFLRFAMSHVAFIVLTGHSSTIPRPLLNHNSTVTWPFPDQSSAITKSFGFVCYCRV